MKKIILFTASLILMLSITTASYAADSYFKMTSCTSDTFTLEWSYPADSFIIKDADGNESDVIKDNKCRIDAVAGYISVFSLYYIDSDGQIKDTGLYSYVNTKPVKCLRKEFGVESLNSSYVNIGFAKDSTISGAELEVTDIATGTKKKYTSSTGSFLHVPCKTNKAYKIRIRSYYINRSNREKYYSSWSSYNGYNNLTVPYYQINTTGVGIKLRGIKGVKEYKIYVSPSGKKGTYKLSRTCKPAAGKTVSYKISKIGSSSMKFGRKYYVQIIPVIDCGKTNVKSQITSDFSFNNY